MQDLQTYFAERTGLGVLATADAEGRPNAAVYARPHVLGEREVAFIMADRLSHANVQVNPFAAYLFREDPAPGGARYAGLRLKLRKTAEEQDTERIERLRRRCSPGSDGPHFLVTFEVEEVLPLVGTERREPSTDAASAGWLTPSP